MQHCRDTSITKQATSAKYLYGEAVIRTETISRVKITVTKSVLTYVVSHVRKGHVKERSTDGITTQLNANVRNSLTVVAMATTTVSNQSQSVKMGVVILYAQPVQWKRKLDGAKPRFLDISIIRRLENVKSLYGADVSQMPTIL